MKHWHVLEDFDRGRKILVVNAVPDFDWKRWFRLNRTAVEAAEEYTKADPRERESLREFLDSLGIKIS